MKIFKDRQSAGKLLAKRLQGIRGIQANKEIMVLGIPRGGVVVAKEIAKKLELPLNVLVTRKIGSPTQQELALGAVDPDGEVIWDQALLDQLKVQNEKLKVEIQEQWKELKRREDVYRAGKPELDVKGKIVILVDDGIATGSTTLAAINYFKRHKAKKIILAVPVASKDSLEKIKEVIDEVVVLEIPEYFEAVGQFYQQFLPVSDEEVVKLLS